MFEWSFEKCRKTLHHKKVYQDIRNDYIEEISIKSDRKR